MQDVEPLIEEKKSPTLGEELDTLNTTLDIFQAQVHEAILGKNIQFRSFLRRCLQAELTEEQTIRIFVECRQFERHYVKPSLLSYANGAVLRKQQNNSNLTIQTARVAVLLGFISYQGVGLPRDEALARRYFDFGVEMKCLDAYLMAGLMAKRGHGQPGRKPDMKKANQYLAELTQDPLLKAIFEGIPEPEAKLLIDTLESKESTTEQDFQDIERHPYPAALRALASLSVLDINALSTDVADEANERRNLIATTAELFLRSYLTSIRLGDRKKAKGVDKQLAELYKDQNEIYTQKVAVLDPSKLTNLSEQAEARDLLSYLQTSAVILQYYYGFIDPSLYETLKTTCPDKELIGFCIMKDGVSSSRVKMRRLIDLLGAQLPDDFFSGQPDDLENLGHIAYQAVADCLALYNHCGAEYQQEIVAELTVFSAFAEDILGRLATYVKNSPLDIHRSQDPKGRHLSNLKKRANSLLAQRYNEMVSSGDAGFGTALRLMIGVTPGSKKLQLSQNPTVARMLQNLLEQNDIDFVFNSEKYKISKIELLIDILEESNRGGQNEEIKMITDKLKDQSFDAISLHTSVIFDHKETLQVIQDLADFLRLIDEARKPALVKKGPASKTLLYQLYKQNQCFLKAIEQAIELFESRAYRPSRVNVFSATFWKSSEYEAQLVAAKELLHVCEHLIFDRIALAKQIHNFLSKSINKQSPVSFALVLMKIMASEENLLIPKDRFNLVQCAKQHAADPEMTFRQFCLTFQDYFLHTDLTIASDVTLKF